jgi:putative tryptophan/tyrosine transport system substrate-binding protein
MRRQPRRTSPLPACGERSTRQACRVRGTFIESACLETPPHPNPLPALAAAKPKLRFGEAGSGEREPRGARIKRRTLIALLGGVAAASAWPLAARAQRPAMPAIGFLGSQSADAIADYLRAFHRGLKDAGYVEGENVAIVYRFAENQLDRLPELAADLVRRRVAVIAASGGPASASAAKTATATLPVVFMVAEDPVRLGLVASLARPGGNLTGVNFFAAELAAKRLELLRELVPGAVRVAVLLNPSEATIAAANLRDVGAAARTMGLQIEVLNASTVREIDAAFATIAQARPDALFISSGPLFTSRRVQLAHLATRHAVPAIHGSRLYPEVGGLMSYGASVADAHRQAGAYTGRILKGAKPADLPVVQSSKFEFVINHQTARMLGLTVPDKLLAIADEVIE